MEMLQVPQGTFKLDRYPLRKKELLRAWDAADEYLLNYLAEGKIVDENASLLIINDGFGALASSLAIYPITSWTDSWNAQQATLQNFQNNKLPATNLSIIKSIESPEGEYSIILIKIPKSLALLEDQLIRIQAFITSATTIVAAGMVKSIHTSTLDLFEKYIGSTKTSLAKKKARLIFSRVDKSITAEKSPYPASYLLEGTDYKIINHANVFSRGSLDIGTRFFLQHIPSNEKYSQIIDLGCGNGLLGLIAAEKNPSAEITFIDESFMAITSAKENFSYNMGANRKAHFQAGDCLTAVIKESADLILNNPPFHQHNAVGDDIAWRMFKQSKVVLKKGGELWVIGNRHLGYHVKLKKLFGNCELIATNKKFVVLKAVNK